MKTFQIANSGFSGYKISVKGILFVCLWVGMLESAFAQEDNNWLSLSAGAICPVTCCVSLTANSYGDDVTDNIEVFGPGDSESEMTSDGGSHGDYYWTGGQCGLVVGNNTLYAGSSDMGIDSDDITVTLSVINESGGDFNFMDPMLSGSPGAPFYTGNNSLGAGVVALITNVSFSYTPGDPYASIAFTLKCAPPYTGLNGRWVYYPSLNGSVIENHNAPLISSLGCTSAKPYLTEASVATSSPTGAAWKCTGVERCILMTVSSDGCNITGWSCSQPPVAGW